MLIKFGFLIGWYLVGLLAALVIPVMKWHTMAGSWKTFFKLWPLFALFGPFAMLNTVP